MANAQNEPVKFANTKYNYVKARYLDSFHGTETKGSVLVNYTTSIPSGFAKPPAEHTKSSSIASARYLTKMPTKNPEEKSESPNRDGRGINIVLNKNNNVPPLAISLATRQKLCRW